MTEPFDLFWQSYPRKIAKQKCKLIWDVQEYDEIADTIIKDVQNRKKNSRQWQHSVYIPHPSTYLNQERWLDEII